MENYPSSSTLRYAGDVSIDKVTITTSKGLYQDITAQVLNIQIFEDLFTPFMSGNLVICLLYTSPSPRDRQKSRMPSSA